MERGQKLYEGKAKVVFATDNPEQYIVYYKDDATAFNGLKKGSIADKGVLNNKITTHFFQLLEAEGIPTHFVKYLSDREQLVKKLDILMVEVVVRNVAAGSLAKRIGFEEGTLLASPVVEFYYKNDDLGDPLVNNYHIQVLKLATPAQLAVLEKVALRINEILSAYLLKKNIRLIDFKLEFGLHQGEILLGDEISPDTCRFWDTGTNEKLDKDRFRRDLGNVEEAYKQILFRLTGEKL
ncbi:MAG TPA: phosphoribosylaminoimidazolesuccinocarboxamide synthase [Firmicutes bacterium]|nr:phosphoribosylaminoimidazolesuccinocarboxamide synthase [Bacillota bacterium]